MTIITYALLPITLLWVSYLLHKRGMKSHLPHCEDWGDFTIPIEHLHPQEKNNPTSEGENE